MRTNIHQKKFYKDLYEHGESVVWSQDNDENFYKWILDRLGDIWIKRQAALDIGCGTGKYSVCLAQMGFKSVLGIDFVEMAILDAKKHQKSNLQYICTDLNLQYICTDLFELDFDQKFNLFFDRGVFTHLEQKFLNKYFDTLDRLGSVSYKILFTCFAEEYHLAKGQKKKNAFYHNGLFFKKYTKDNLLHVFDSEFRIIELTKVYKSSNRVFWHLLVERKKVETVS